jgi:hypothetical protein
MTALPQLPRPEPCPCPNAMPVEAGVQTACGVIPGVMATRAAMCATCRHRAPARAGMLESCTLAKRPTTQCITSGQCPANRFPDERHHVTWKFVRWYGAPHLIRLRLVHAWRWQRLQRQLARAWCSIAYGRRLPAGPMQPVPRLSAANKLPECGCVVVLKNAWVRVSCRVDRLKARVEWAVWLLTV